MTELDTKSRFKAKLLMPAKPGSDTSWTFVVLPKDASERLARRGRTTVDGTINGYAFRATLEPDGQLSHLLRVSREMREGAGADIGDVVTLEIKAAEKEPEPEVPSDFLAALAENSEARTVWDSTTTIARLDWIHWVTSAKQAKTRAQRIANGCDMLASGKRRVCCFDESGYYSKAFSAPQAAD
jgi:hypothetical protein